MGQWGDWTEPAQSSSFQGGPVDGPASGNHRALCLGLLESTTERTPLSWPVAQGPKGRRGRPPGYA